MRHRTGTELLLLAEEVERVYAEVFSAPPWSKSGEGLAQFGRRLPEDARRPGFRAAVAGAPGRIDGFATGWTTQRPFRSDRAYGRVSAQLGARRVEELLVGALEVDELAVLPRARGTGLGRALLAALTGGAPGGRAWLLTARGAADTVAFYHRVGWHEVPPLPGRENDVVVFLAPGHPGAAEPR
ncbi:GNAT family N-acetyltransferase [Streptomyces capparidis]